MFNFLIFKISAIQTLLVILLYFCLGNCQYKFGFMSGIYLLIILFISSSVLYSIFTKKKDEDEILCLLNNEYKRKAEVNVFI